MTSLREREFNPLKILHHIDRLRTLADNRDITPVTIEIDPVAYCNHTCDWCVDPAHHPLKMAEQTFATLIEELTHFTVSGYRVEGVVLKGGGEPTLHPDFASLVKRAADAGFSIGVVTNGSRLDRWTEILAAHAAYVRISIDGPTAESHSLIHHSKDFEAIVQNVKQLVKARNTRRRPVIGLSFAMDNRTVELADQAIRLGDALGVDYVLLRPPFFEEVGHPSTMTIKEAQRVRQHLGEASAGYQGPMEIFVGNWIGDVEQTIQSTPSMIASGRRDFHLSKSLPIEHRTARCLASPLLAVVTADGHLYGCCNLRALPAWSFGQLDYTKGVGFTELWQGQQRRQTLARMHHTECIRHCTHPLSRYNEMIEVLSDKKRPHSEFV